MWVVTTIFASLVTALAATSAEKEPIHELTDASFDGFIAKNKCVLVLFYVPDCRFCKQFEPELDEVATKVGRRGLDCRLVRTDMRKNPKIKERLDVFEYPTLKLFLEGMVLDYLGPREHIALTNYLAAKLESKSLELESMDDFEEVRQAEVSAVLLMPKIDPKQLRVFEIFFSGFEDLFFFHSALPEALQRWTAEPDAPYHFLVFTHDSDKPKVRSSQTPLTLQDIKLFFDEARFPLVFELDGPSSERIFTEKRSTVFLFSDKKEFPFRSTFQEVAQLFSRPGRKADLLFCHTSLQVPMGVRLAEYFLMTDANHNSIRILEFRDGRPLRYALDQFDESKLIKLIEDVLRGKAKPYFKSEPLPPANQSTLVRKVVGRNFAEVVLKTPQSVLLFVVSPNCGHCKKLSPEIDALATKYLDSPTVIIAKMDGTLNEVEELDVQGYPTIVFFPATDKANPVGYPGERTAREMGKWLETELQRAAVAGDL